MQSWNRHWYGSVAAIRPYLFQKCFLLVVAFDLLVLMIERGGRYGLDAVAFNVPHFAWLDQFHALFLSNGVPDATYYVAVLVLTSFLAMCPVFGGHRSWLMAVVAVLYTYAWSMSRLDSYLHHYMLSLILGCMIFFPAIDGRAFRDWWISQNEPSNNKRKTAESGSHAGSLRTLATLLIALAVAYRISLMQSVGLTDLQRWVSMFACTGILGALVYRWSCMLPKTKASNEPSEEDVGPTVSAWAVRLLGTTVGVIYVFTSIAKMDMEWCGGHTLRQVGTTADVLLPLEQFAAQAGIGTEWFWSGLATFVIPLELVLAAMYFISVRQDEPNRQTLRRICFLGWLLAVGLHLNNEMMNLIIQWFGYYMLLLATIFLLPARILTVVASFFYGPESWIRDRYDRAMGTMTNGQASAMLGVVSMLALVMLIVFAFFTQIPGMLLASIIVAAGLVLVLVYGLVAGWERNSIRVSSATLVASLLMTIAVAQSSMRFDYYDLRGKTIQQLGGDEPAIMEMEAALAFPPPSPEAAAELHTNLGLSYRRMNNTDDAVRNYRQAIRLNPGQFLAHYSLGNMLVNQQPDEAEKHYRLAIAIKSDFSDAYVNLGNVLEFKNQIQDAISCYQAALSIEKDAPDIQQMIESARKKLETAPSQDAPK